MRSFYVCILVLVGSVAAHLRDEVSQGTVTISSDSTTSIAIGTRVKLSCQVTPLTNSISWFAAADTAGTTLTICLATTDMCIPASYGNYTFSSDFSTGKYVLEILSFSATDLVFTCSHATTPEAQTDTITLSVKVPTTTTTTTTQGSTTEPDAGSNTGLIVGIVVGVLVLAGVVVGLVLLNIRMKQQNDGKGLFNRITG